MASIVLEKVTKVYPNGLIAVRDLDLTVDEGQLMVLVGPSGCGKTTALRMVAGLENISAGSILIGDRMVNDVSPKDRNIAMVFQNYALYPHMTVRDNIGFALKLRKIPKVEIQKKVDDAAAVLGLTEWLDRKPGQLSGGQQQRVAMGRAIVREPSIFLMDEPLSNLDAQLRVQMRTEVARVQRSLGVATIYVTHDQVEAMTLGDAVAVMRGGILQQCDNPQEIYDHPKNIFVAGFMGSPPMNLFEATVVDGAAAVMLGSQRIEFHTSLIEQRTALREYDHKLIALGIRPEDIEVASGQAVEPTADRAQVVGHVEHIEALGSELLVHFTVDASQVVSEGLEDTKGLPESTLIRSGGGIARIGPRSRLVVGERVSFLLDPLRLHFFDLDTGQAITVLSREDRGGGQ